MVDCAMFFWQEDICQAKKLVGAWMHALDKKIERSQSTALNQHKN